MSLVKARYLLPEENDGPRDCVQIPVPQDVNHRAAFWGQIHALGSARLWANDESHAALDAAQVWRDISDSIKLNAEDCHCNEFYILPDFVYCPDLETNRKIFQITLCDNCPDVEPVVFSGSYPDEESGYARTGYTFALLSDNTPCGVHVCSVAGIGLGSILATYDWTLQWRDCLDEDHEEIVNGAQAFYFEDFEAKKLCLTCTARFAAVVSTSGPVVCVEA